MTHTEATPDHTKGMGTDAIEAVQGDPIQHTEATGAEPTMTHHTGHTTDNPHTTAHMVTALRTAVGHIHIHPTDCQNIFQTTEDHAVQDHTPTKGPKTSNLNRNRKVHIEEPQSDFYSLDDNSTNSGEKLESLN